MPTPKTKEPETTAPLDEGDVNTTTTPAPAEGDPNPDPGTLGTEQSAETAPVTEPGEETLPPSDEEPEELDDELIGKFATAYKDKLLSSPDIQEEVRRQIREQVEAEIQEVRHTQENRSAVDKLVEQGKTAVNSMTGQAQAAKAELEKAKAAMKKLQDGDEDVKLDDLKLDVFDTIKFGTDLRTYGTAIATDVARTYDSAVEDAFDAVVGKIIPGLDEKQQGQLRTIIENAQRMEGDEAQAPRAKSYFMVNMVSFLVNRAIEQGELKERQRVAAQKELREKIASKAAVVAAAAERANGNLPPAAPVSRPGSGDYIPSIEEYSRLKREGKTEEAQRVVDELTAARRSGG